MDGASGTIPITGVFLFFAANANYVEGASNTNHITQKFLFHWANAVATMLLPHTESVVFTAVDFKLLFGAGDAFLSGAKIDVVLFVICSHKKFLQFSFSETEEKGRLPNGRS